MDGRGGEARLRDVRAAGIGKGDLLAGTGKRFDNELLVTRDDVNGREGLAVRQVLGIGTATFFVPLVFRSPAPDVCFNDLTA